MNNKGADWTVQVRRLVSCTDPESFVREGPTLTSFFLFVFLVDEGREDPNTSISGPSSACQRMPMMANIECWLSSLVIFQEIRTSIARKPYIFVILQGGRVWTPVPPPSGSTHGSAPLLFTCNKVGLSWDKVGIIGIHSTSKIIRIL